MGVVFSACQSAQIGVTLQDSEEKHKLLPDIAATASIRKQYEADGTVPVGCDKEMLGLRVFLTDQMALRNFGEYARRKNRTELLICWTEFLEFKCISHVNRVYKRSVAQFLVDKYLAETPLVKLAGITMNPDYRHRVLEAVRLADSDVEDLSLKIFNEFHQQCLKTIHDTLYVNFVKTRLFAESIREFKGICSSISPDDFEYFEMLGEGGFGFVVHVRKKSTGVHHAMKIQRKKGLLDVFARSPVHVLYEKNALVRCQHPFIVGLDYAFQTRSLSFLVMDLGTVGNLLDATRALGRLSEVRVRLYAAEIVLALNHIHELGFIYRDLKPSNVILTAAGHIQLVDLGAIVDTGNRLLSVIHTLGRSVNSSDDPNPTTYHQCGANSTNSGCFDASLYGEWGAGNNSSTACTADIGPGHGESRQIPDQISSVSRALSSSYNKPASCTLLVTPGSSKSAIAGQKVLNSENVSVNSGSEKLPTLNSLSADGLASLVFSSSKTLNNTVASPNVVSSVSYNFGRAKTVVGTAGYMAPEVLAMSIRDGSSMGYTKAVDYWSLGMIVLPLFNS
jgi:serine/threonine protein kinase